MDPSKVQSPFELIDAGTGDAVVLVHGSASDRRTWDEAQAALSEQFRVVSYSRRWHWPNDPPGDDDDYSMIEHVDDLCAVIESLDAGPVHVVGHSYGGFVVLLAALGRPELLRSMVLIEPPVVPLFLSDPPRPRELLRLVATRPWLALHLIKFGARGIGPATKAAERNEMNEAIRISGTAILGKEAFEALTKQRWAQVLDNNLRAEYVGSGFAPLESTDVEQIDTPTLVVTGDRGPKIWGLLAAELVALLPHATLAEIPDASHIVHEDNLTQFAGLVREFLAD